MNRRGLFTFLGTAPLGAAVALTIAPEPKPPVLVANEHKCACGSPHFHYVPKTAEVYPPEERNGIRITFRRYAGFDTKCLWCNAPWTGPVPADTVL